jgi:putative transposase
MQNSKMALAIGEVGWYQFKTMLQYKAQWYGKNLLSIGRFSPSSKLCSQCGWVFKEQRLKDRSWTLGLAAPITIEM